MPRELRERIEELHERLGIALPGLRAGHQADLLAGFMEFFADFDKDERAQVWGVTFPYQADTDARRAADASWPATSPRSRSA